jgi:predicted enzyme related to lactoylglutathione lyase
MPDSDTELVLQTERPGLETDLLVESVDAAAARFTDAGGTVVAGPFEIPVGRVVIVADPWGNQLVLLDLSKGTYQTDGAGNVTGVSKRIDG